TRTSSSCCAPWKPREAAGTISIPFPTSPEPILPGIEGVLMYPTPKKATAGKPVTISSLAKMKASGEKFAALTAYDASFAALLDAAGVDVVLVGDTVGMVVQGHSSTVPVTVDDMIYHGRMVARGLHRALLMLDMPFMSYATPEAAL